VELLEKWMSIVANVGVLAGIVFLAFEIQVNTDAVRSATYQGFIDSSFSWADTMVEHAGELAEIQQHNNLDDLTAEQFMTWNGFAHKAITTMESNYLHHRAGSLDDDVFEGRTALSVEYLLESPLLLESFRSGRHTSTKEFDHYFEARIQAAQAR
jgi:hypothetical protein